MITNFGVGKAEAKVVLRPRSGGRDQDEPDRPRSYGIGVVGEWMGKA